MAALIPRDNVEAVGKKVDDLAFAFVAPLRAKHDDIAVVEFKPDYCSSRREIEPPCYPEYLCPDIFLGSGLGNLVQQFRTVSIGKLKTYQLLRACASRFHMSKLNRKLCARSRRLVWARIASRMKTFATDAPDHLVSHLEMIKDVLEPPGDSARGRFLLPRT